MAKASKKRKTGKTSPPKKRKVSRTTKAKRAAQPPAKAGFARRSVPGCKCEQADDELFYCFKQVQGRWIPCRGPYNSLSECIDKTGERCA